MPTFPTFSDPQYCTVDLLIDFVPFLNSITTVTSQHLTRVIQLAEGEINAKLAPRFTLPVTTSMDITFLTDMALNLASYKALTRHFHQVKQNVSEYVKDYLAEYERMLEQLLNDEIELVDTNNNVIDRGDNAEAESNTEDYETTIFEGDPSEWRRDPNRVKDERQARE